MPNRSLLLTAVSASLVLASLTGCADRARNYGYYDQNAAEEESLRSTAPSAAPVVPRPDDARIRQIPPSWSPRSPGVVKLGPIDSVADPDSKPMYLASVRSRLSTLAHEILRIHADAKTRSTAAQTAITPATVDFARAQDQVEASLAMAQRARGEQWDAWQRSIETGMFEAEKAVLQANAALVRTPAAGY